MKYCKSISESDINFIVLYIELAIIHLQNLTKSFNQTNITINYYLKQVNNVLNDLITVFEEYEDYIVDKH